MLVDEVLFYPDVPSEQAGDEMIRELMAIVESAHHLLLFDDQDRTWCECYSGRRAEDLPRHAFCAEVVSTMHNREDRLLTPLRLNCELNVPFLDVEHFLASVTLRTDALPFTK